MKFENEAKELCEALKVMVSNDYSIENFESYLSYHFDKWIEKYASTPEGMVHEIKHFSTITGG